ncbi:MAG: hypothetical protein ACRD6N_04765 [Pyrinomonadaceae bacterium]
MNEDNHISKFEERMAGIEETLKRVADVLARTTERLNILVNTVERYISERRNGKS